MIKKEILIIDDEQDIRLLVAGLLEDEGYVTRQAGSDREALEQLELKLPDLVILDIWLEGSSQDGVELLKKIKAAWPSVPVVMISGHGTIETAVNAIKHGAYDFIEKPFKMDRLLLQITRAIEAASLREENKKLRQQVSQKQDNDGPVLGAVEEDIKRVAPTNSRLLISGPPGSGKEYVARQVHNASLRAENPFIVVNCASLSSENVVNELFGVENHASNGLQSLTQGVFEQADQGTLVFDEITDLPKDVQGNLVRVLQEQSFVRVGGKEKVSVDVRVLTLTSKDLLLEVEQGRFREDLYYRLAIVPLDIPSLSENREDISHLAHYFLERFSVQADLPVLSLSEEAQSVLKAYDWPGNVRQLRNVMEWLVIMEGRDGQKPVTPEQLPQDLMSRKALDAGAMGGEILSLPLREAREIFERNYLESQVQRFSGNVTKTANFVGMERSALHRKLRSLGLSGSKEE